MTFSFSPGVGWYYSSFSGEKEGSRTVMMLLKNYSLMARSCGVRAVRMVCSISTGCSSTIGGPSPCTGRRFQNNWLYLSCAQRGAVQDFGSRVEFLRQVESLEQATRCLSSSAHSSKESGVRMEKEQEPTTDGDDSPLSSSSSKVKDSNGEQQPPESEFVRASREKEEARKREEASLTGKVRKYVNMAKEKLSGLKGGSGTDWSEAWSEVIGNRPAHKSTVVRKLKRPEEGSEGQGTTEAPENSGALVLVKGAGEAWQKLGEKLKEAPVIEDLVKGTQAVRQKTGITDAAKKAKHAVDNKVEDAREVWETSQHPLIYEASGIVHSVVGETEMGTAMRELRRMDPWFNLETWKADLTDHLLPDLMEAYLQGDATAMAQWTSEGPLKKMTAEFQERMKSGKILGECCCSSSVWSISI